jgi:Tfp pilus assembly protein PilF
MIICPILSQQRRAEDGSVAWEHHECLRDGCTFWAAEFEDCALRASGLRILRRKEESPPPPEPEGPAAAELLAELSARLAEVEKKVEAETTRAVAANRDLGIRLLEGVAALEEPVNALREEAGRIAAHISGTAEALDRAAAAIAEQKSRDEERAGRERLAEARACNARGLALHHGGTLEAAEAAFRRAVELDPALAEAHNNLGIVLGRLGRPEEAAACFEKALEIRPDLGGALNNLGFLCHQGMQFERAVEMFARAALAGGDASIAFTNLGNALYRLSRGAEAVEAWRRAVEIDPLNENAARALRMYEGAEAAS